MRFSKDKFNKNALKTTKKLLSKHLDVLDGMEVKFDEAFGEIEKYTVNGEEFWLYPIHKEWCEESPFQMSLFKEVR